MMIFIPAGIWAVHEVLGKEYRGYRVALVLSQETELERRLARTPPE